MSINKPQQTFWNEMHGEVDSHNKTNDLDRKSTESELFERDLATYLDDVQVEVRRRYEYLTWIEKHLAGGWTQNNLEPLLVEAAKEIEYPPPKWRTLAKWWSLYSSSGKKITSLVPKVHLKGNRKQKVENDTVFFERAVERYLVPERPSIAAVYEYYSDLIRRENMQLVGEKIQALSYKGFYNRIKKLPAYEVAVARHGKYLADIEFNKIDAHLPPSRVLEKVEIDHSPLDLILLDDELDIPLGRPYLTLLIDQYSKSIVGFHLGFKDPSYYSVMKGILNAIKPKTDIHERFPSIENEWYCQGKMESLVVDNGAEFWSKSLEQSCLEVGIHIQYNPVRKPWLKPLVERLFRTISSKLLVSIPGKTFSNILEREEYDSRKDAVMHFSTFNELFHKWIIDVYHYDSDSKKRAIPYLKWQEGVSVMPPITYSHDELEKLSVILGLKENRKHRRGGIHLHGLRYDSEELADYRRMNPSDIEVLTKTDPDDISSVYVYLEREQRYLKVPCIDPVGYTKKLSLTQHNINKRLCRDFISDKLDLDALARVRLYIHDRIEQEAEEINNLSRGATKRKTKGMARLAKHNGVASDSNANCEPEVLPELSLTHTKPDSKFFPGSDDWDEFISELDPY
ncbi:transposase family protein [Photobacterium proteolyticum]|nr:transposase family protein [Photobacterium proteolyticum]